MGIPKERKVDKMKGLLCIILGHKTRDTELNGFQARHCIRCTEIEPFNGIPKRTEEWKERHKADKKHQKEMTKLRLGWPIWVKNEK